MISRILSIYSDIKNSMTIYFGLAVFVTIKYLYTCGTQQYMYIYIYIYIYIYVYIYIYIYMCVCVCIYIC